MTRSPLASPWALAALIAIVLLAIIQIDDHRTASAASAAVPRTPWGAPDLQGIWEGRANAPLERPKEHAGQEFLTAQEAAALDKKNAETEARERAQGRSGDNPAYENDQFRDQPTALARARRTSLIVDPRDGRIPPLTQAGQQKDSARTAYRRLHPTDGPEDRSLFERCLVGLGGLPRLVGGSNSNVQIVQTPEYVAIYHEMIHETRIIPIDDRPHLPAGIRQWLGDSRGHWEGTTLVVDTTNFMDMTRYRRASDKMHLIERFRRVDAETLEYEVTIDDPATFVRPWTAILPMPRVEATIYEYACHEGNYGLRNQLTGARAEERARAAANK